MNILRFLKNFINRIIIFDKSNKKFKKYNLIFNIAIIYFKKLFSTYYFSKILFYNIYLLISTKIFKIT